MVIIMKILAILVILLVVFMKGNENRIIGLIGIGIIIWAKISFGFQELNLGFVVLVGLAVIGAVVSLPLLKENDVNSTNDHWDNILNKHSIEEFNEIIVYDILLRDEIEYINILLAQKEITKNEYNLKLKAINKAYKEVQERYNLTKNEMEKYYRFNKKLNN